MNQSEKNIIDNRQHKKKIYHITEYGMFVTGKNKDKNGCTFLPKEIFDRLENFILSAENKSNDISEIFDISVKKGVGKVIAVKNYIGVLMLSDGPLIEILPKIYTKSSYDEKQLKKIVIDMIRTLKDTPYKSMSAANVDIAKNSIFEIFIRMFIDEVFFIVKRGLKNSYETVSSNERFVKGKIVFSEHIKHNYAHKEMTYVAYDEFNSNRPENKLIKSTLLLLYRLTHSAKNKTDIKTLLNAFCEVSPTVKFSGDFKKLAPDRNMKDYENALAWCKVFLKGNSFTSFAGCENAFALFYPMETLFESYVAVQLNRILRSLDFTFSTQDCRHCLFEYPTKKFMLKPDIVIERNSDNTVFICDTKWKLLDKRKDNYGILPADMYQMYVYQKKYKAENVTLIYPMTDDIPNNDIQYRFEDGFVVRIRFVDLLDIKTDLGKIAADFIN